MSSGANVTVNLGKLADPTLDLTKQMLKAADIVAQEMRGNIMDGLDAAGQALTPNSAVYAKRKLQTLGHARPLIGKNRTLVSKSSYQILATKTNAVIIKMIGIHPDAALSIGQLGYIHHFGKGNNPVRAFAGITEFAKKRIVGFLRDEIARLFK